MNKLIYEIKIFYGYIGNDLLATVVPGVLFTLVATIHINSSLNETLFNIFISLIYFSLYAYSFTIVNQFVGLQEDKVNKPSRPIPSGTESLDILKIRVIIVNLIFVILGQLFGVLIWAIYWLIINFFHNLWGHKHWITKNLISMSLGIFVMFSAAWNLVTPITQEILIWGIFVSILNGFCGVIQDFRDKAGDELIDRKTLTIDFGEARGRKLASIMILISMVLTIFYYLSTSTNLITYFILSATISLYLLIVFRLNKFRQPHDDHITYTLLLLQFNFMIISGLFIL